MRLNKIGIIIGFITCLNAVFMVSLISLLPLCSEIWSQLYILFIMLILQNVLIHQIFDIEKNNDLQKVMDIIHFILLIFGAIIFFYLFFHGFYPLQKISFETVSNCQITGEMNKSLQGSESYSILYTSFEYNGQKMLGYSCKSNNFIASYGQHPKPFLFIKQDEYYLCKNPIRHNQTSYDVPPQKIGVTSRQRISGSYFPHPYSAGTPLAKGIGCRPYDFSNIKLASWLCIDSNIDYKQMIKPQKCYVNFYNNQEKAFENAQQFRDLRMVNNFALITFKYPVYYDQQFFQNMIIYALFPSLISFDMFYQRLVKYIYNNQQNMNTVNQFNDNKIYSVLKILMVLQWTVVVLDYKILNYFLKPSVVGLMCFYTLTLQAKEKSNYKYIIATGFFFSVGGDTLLLVENLDFFLYGLVSFALSHICFILAYLQSVQFNLKKILKITLPLTILNFLVGKFMFFYLTSLPNFQQFMVTPLAVYIVLISLHATIASTRVKTSFKSYIYALIGGYFFIASDSILSLNIFAGFNHPIFLFLIMFTYYVSEYFILISTVYHLSYEITQEKIQKGTQNAPKSSLQQQIKPQMPKHNMTVVELQTPHMKIPGVQKYSHDELKQMLEKAKQFPAVHEGFYLKVQNYDFQVDEWELETGNSQPHTDESKLNMRPKTAVTADQRRIELAKKSQQARQQMQEKYEKEQNPTFKRPATAKVVSKKKIESVKESKQQSNNIIENEPEVNSEHEDNQEEQQQEQDQQNGQENNQENQEEAEEYQDADQQNIDEEDEQNDIKSKQTLTSKKQQTQKQGKEKKNSKTQIKNQEIDQQEEDEDNNSYKIQKISKEKQKQNKKKNYQNEDEMDGEFDEDDFNNQIEQFSISQAFNQSNYSQLSKGKQKQSVKPKGPYKSDVANMMSSMFSEISGFETDI
ncbi:hypothetical protein ABPG72_008338 [Tetrahymena utriculariae]